MDNERTIKGSEDRPLARGTETSTTRTDDVSRPAATGTGAVVGGTAGGLAGATAAGAAAGGMTGPIGAVVGAAAGARVGALAGKGIARAADPDVEDAYWRESYSSRPYVDGSAPYDDYSPAYRYGVDAWTRHGDRSFDDVESDLGRGWDSSRGSSSLDWDRARHASRDAWQRLSDRVERAVPGDSDRDGR